MEHLITLYHEDWDPTLPSTQFVWWPCGSYIFGSCLSVSLHWSCIMILWMRKTIPIFSIYVWPHCLLPTTQLLNA
ncbi:unnamed protein product [Sphagnum balticum]